MVFSKNEIKYTTYLNAECALMRDWNKNNHLL